MNNKRRILVVDDEPVIRLFLQELFEDEGYDVVTAQTIAEGLAALAEGNLNLVVTDKNLPDGTGFEIVHAAKELDPPCEAMIVTGYASLDSAVMALQIGAYDYILKPIEDVDLLLEKARKAIEKQDIHRELHSLRARLAIAEKAAATPAPAPAASNEGTAPTEITGGLPQLMKLAELGSLIPMLSHEIRQPLAGVKGYVDLLLHKKTLESNVREKLVAVQEQVVHMTVLLDSMMSYSRVARPGEQIVDMRRPLDLALSIFPVLRGKGRYELITNVAEDLPPVRGNVNSLQQVLVNLVKNAKDAVDECDGGRIEVTMSTDAAGENLLVRVEDSGPGMTADVRAMLFQPFFTTKQEGVGTGLGLTICRQIVADHGGRIDIESPLTASGGAAFTLVLPAVRQPVAAGAGSRA